MKQKYISGMQKESYVYSTNDKITTTETYAKFDAKSDEILNIVRKSFGNCTHNMLFAEMAVKYLWLSFGNVQVTTKFIDDG